MYQKLMLFTTLFFLPSALFSSYGVQYRLVSKEAKQMPQHFIQKTLPKMGWSVSSSQSQAPTHLISNDKAMRSLLLKAPELGAFSLFNLYNYQDGKNNYLGHIHHKTMLGIVGIDDKSVVKAFSALFKPLDKSMRNILGKKQLSIKYEDLPRYPMVKFTYTFKNSQALQTFQNNFSSKIKEAYSSISHKNYKQIYQTLNLDFKSYDHYSVYTLHSNTLFSTILKKHPQAQVFSPSSIYMYSKKNEKTLHIGIPKLENIPVAMGIKDKQIINEVKHLDNKIFTLMKDLGATEIIPPKLQKENDYQTALKRAKKESKPLVIFMNHKDCGACQYMKKTTFMNEELIRYLNKNFVMLWAAINSNNLPKDLQVKVTPVFHFLKGDGTKAIPTLFGGKNVEKFMPYLKSALKAK